MLGYMFAVSAGIFRPPPVDNWHRSNTPDGFHCATVLRGHCQRFYSQVSVLVFPPAFYYGHLCLGNTPDGFHCAMVLREPLSEVPQSGQCFGFSSHLLLCSPVFRECVLVGSTVI